MQSRRCKSQQNNQRKFIVSSRENKDCPATLQTLNRKVRRLQFRLKSGEKKQARIVKSTCDQQTYELFIQQKRTIQAYQNKIQSLEKKLLEHQNNAKQQRVRVLLDQNNRLKAYNQQLAATCSTLMAFNSKAIDLCLTHLGTALSKRDRKSLVRTLRPRCMSLMREQQVELQTQRNQLRWKIDNITKKNQKLQKELLQLFRQNQLFRKKVSAIAQLRKPVLINQQVQCKHEIQETSFSSLEQQRAAIKSAQSQVQGMQLESGVFRKIQMQEKEEEGLNDFDWNDKAILQKTIHQRKKQIKKQQIKEICEEIKYGMAYRNLSMDFFAKEFTANEMISLQEVVEIIRKSNLVRFNSDQIECLAKYLMEDKAPLLDTTTLRNSAIIKSIFRSVIGHVEPFRASQAPILNSLKSVIMTNLSSLREFHKRRMQVGVLREWLGKELSVREEELLNLVRVCECKRNSEVCQFVQTLKSFEYNVCVQ